MQNRMKRALPHLVTEWSNGNLCTKCFLDRRFNVNVWMQIILFLSSHWLSDFALTWCNPAPACPGMHLLSYGAGVHLDRHVTCYFSENNCGYKYFWEIYVLNMVCCKLVSTVLANKSGPFVDITIVWIMHPQISFLENFSKNKIKMCFWPI